MEQILFLKICRNGKDSTADHNVSFKVLIHSQTSPQRPLRGQKKMAVVERFKQESMYGLFAKKSGRCREVAVIRGSTVTTETKSQPGFIKTLYKRHGNN